MDYTLNIRGRLLSLETPLVMGILNVTPDSFYAGSRAMSDEAIAQRAQTLVGEGAAIIDIGGCSTRPGGTLATEAEETDRVRRALEIVKAATPAAIVSIDTFRASVARMAINEFGADIINDVSGGEDPRSPDRSLRPCVAAWICSPQSSRRCRVRRSPAGTRQARGADSSTPSPDVPTPALS